MCILLVKKLEKGNITTKSGSLRNSVQKCGKILRGEKILSPPWFQHCGGERLRRPRRSDTSGVLSTLPA